MDKVEPVKAWGIGDAIEVAHYERTENFELREVWRPATVCGLSPLSVAFADGSRLALHDRSKRRRPVTIKPDETP